MIVALDFDVTEAVFTGNGDDLVITVEGQGVIVIEDFRLLAEQGALPTFELMGGELVPGDVYLFAFNDVEAAEELETAAEGSSGSSGAGVYSDDSGELVGGVDSLPGQGFSGSGRNAGGSGGDTPAFSTADTSGASSNPPTINGTLSIVTDEDTPTVITAAQILALASDPDPGSVLSVADLAVAGGTLTQVAAGTWLFTPDQDYNGTIDVTFSVSDGVYTVQGNGTVTVAPVNDAPEAAGDTATVDEDGTVLVDVLANDTDIDGDTLTLTSVGPVTNAAGAVVGTAVIQDGQVLFTPNANYNGDASFEYTVSDGQGGTATATAAVTVAPVNDAPEAAGDTATVDEDGTVLVDVLANDTDIDGDTLTLTSVGPVTNAAGAVVGTAVIQDGQVLFTPNANYNGDASFEYTVSDGQGGTATATAAVTVAPVNDAPEAAGDTATVDEDGTVLVDVLANDTDIDGDTLTLTSVGPVTNAAGAVVGTAVIQDGQVLFTPNANYNGDASFEYTVSDGQGGTATATAAVTVNAVNDAATFTGRATATRTEDRGVNGDGELTATGRLRVTDIDSEARFTGEVSGGSAGTLSITPEGRWTYTVDNGLDAIQQLGRGDTLVETFTVVTEDGTTTDITITVKGTNDVAVIGASSGQVTEDTALSVSGTIAVEDVDLGEGVFQDGTARGRYGSLVIDEAGNWTYTLDGNARGAVQRLGEGDTLTDTVVVRSADGTRGTIEVTINGTNDVPTISGRGKTLTEDRQVNADGDLTATGRLSIRDADAGESLFEEGTLDGDGPGTLTINADGTYTYSASNESVQHLGRGETLTDTFTVTSIDGTATHEVTFTIVGTNDVPVIGGTSTGTAREDVGAADGVVTVSGTLTIDDADAEESRFQAMTADRRYGSFEMDTEGNWTYAVDNSLRAVQRLGEGDTLTDTVVVRSADGTTQRITVTIEGTNDAPVFGGTSERSLTEDYRVNVDGDLTASGRLTISDVDAGENRFVDGTYEGQYGTVTLAANGRWTYAAANGQEAIQGLSPDTAPLEDVITVTSVDGTTTTITITINGTEDAPEISGVSTGSVVEDDTASVSGTLTAADADANDTPVFAAGETEGAYGSLVIDAAGNWTYALNANAQALSQGQQETETFTVTATTQDGETVSRDITISVTGTNDAPVLEDKSLSTDEDTPVLITSQMLLENAADAEGDALSVVAVNADGLPGQLADNGDGTWTFTPDRDWNGELNLSYTVSDGTDESAATLALTVNAVNDAPELTFSAPDTSHNYVANGSFEQVAGGYDIGAGDWANGRAPEGWTLEAGDRWEVMDGDRHGIIGATDGENVIDTGVGGRQALVISQQITGLTAGQYVIALDAFDRGANLGEPDSGRIDVLWNGEPVGSINPGSAQWETGTFTVTVGDGDGTLTLASYNADGYANVIDNVRMYAVQTGETVPVTIAENAAPGSVVATAIGTDVDSAGLTFSIENNDSPFVIDPATGVITLSGSLDHEAAGSHTITVAVDDGDGGVTTRELTINVGDVNEAPVVSGPLALDAMAEDGGAVTLTAAQLLANASDPDGDALYITGLTLAEGQGTLADNGDGSWTFTPAADWSGEVRFDYTVTDGEMSATTSASLDVAPVNDAPVIGFALAAPDTGTNLVTNGSFENLANGGDIATGDWAGGTAPVGWTLEAGDRWEVMDGDRHGIIGASDGENVIDTGVGSRQALVISQSVDIPEAGSYLIELDLFDRGANLREADSGNIDVLWNGEIVATFNPGTTQWETGRVLITAEAGSGTLTLASHNADGYANVIDNVRMYAVNQAEGDAVTVAETAAGGSIVASVVGADVDSMGLTYSLSDPDGDLPFTIDAATGVITLKQGMSLDHETTPAYTVEVAVSDGDLTTTRQLTINVGDVNERPAGQDIDLGSIHEDGVGGDGSITFTAAQLLTGATDPEGDALSIANLTIAEGQGTLTDNGGGSWTFTPDQNWNGNVAFGYEITDGELSTPQTASLTVIDTNETPVAGDDSFGTVTVTEGVTMDVTTPDSGVNTAQVLEQWAAQGVTVRAMTGDGMDAGSWSETGLGTKNVSFSVGGDSYAYSGLGVRAPGNIDGGEVDLLDGSHETATELLAVSFDKPMQSVTLEISALFDGTDGAPYDRGHLEVARVAAYDADGALLGHVNVEGTVNGLATVTLDVTELGYGLPIASVAVMPLANSAGDSGNNSDFLLRGVSGESMTEVTGSLLEDHTVTLDPAALLANDTDPDGDALTITAVGNATHGTVALAEDGRIVFEPEADFNGQATFSYTVSDGNGGFDTATVALSITAVNDAPTLDLDATGTHLDIGAADSDSWAYNVLGMYVLDAQGAPVSTSILYGYTDMNGPDSPRAATPHSPGDLLAHLEDGQTPHFFILNSGTAERTGAGLREDSPITFSQDESGQWYGTGVTPDGDTLTLKAFFDDPAMNLDNHLRFSVEATGPDGTVTMGVEEFIGKSKDFDDIRFTVTEADDDATGYAATFETGGDPVSIAGDIAISDVDSAMMSKAVITLTNAVDGDVLDTEGVSGLFVDVDTLDGQIVVTLSGSATAAEYESAIKAITFATTADAGDATPRQITVRVTDAEGNESLASDAATGTIRVTEPGITAMDVSGQEAVFVSQSAGYNNMLGIYTLDERGNPSDPEVVLFNSKTAVPQNVLKTFAGDDQVRFFLIPNVAASAVAATDALAFVWNGRLGQWELSVTGDDNRSDYLDVKFDDPTLNPAGEETGFWASFIGEDGHGVAPGMNNLDDSLDAGFTAGAGETVEVRMDDQFAGQGNNANMDSNPYKKNGAGDDDDDFNDLVVEVRGTEDGHFTGGSGDDVAYGNAGDDTLEGNAGNDTLIGGTGNDLLVGGAGDDLLVGGTGDDIFAPGSGRDVIHTGDGHDTIIIDPSVLADGGGEITVEDFAVGTDAIGLRDGMHIDTINYGTTEDNIDYADVLVSDDSGSHVVVKLLGVSQTDLSDHETAVTHDDHVDDLLQYMIDSGANNQ
jgi:VCBS repeat-containing protein